MFCVCTLLVWLMGEAARLLCLLSLSPVDDRNILMAICHHPVTVERWMLERQPCWPLKHLTVHLRDVHACVYACMLVLTANTPALSCFGWCPQRGAWVGACLCCSNQVVISTQSDCSLCEKEHHGVMSAAKVRLDYILSLKLSSFRQKEMLFVGQKIIGWVSEHADFIIASSPTFFVFLPLSVTSWVVSLDTILACQ